MTLVSYGIWLRVAGRRYSCKRGIKQNIGMEWGGKLVTSWGRGRRREKQRRDLYRKKQTRHTESETNAI